jgi:hypothetical protein
MHINLPSRPYQPFSLSGIDSRRGGSSTEDAALHVGTATMRVVALGRRVDDGAITPFRNGFRVARRREGTWTGVPSRRRWRAFW